MQSMESMESMGESMEHISRQINTRHYGEHLKDCRQSGYVLCRPREGRENFSKWPPVMHQFILSSK